jgi:hypothetical protein
VFGGFVLALNQMNLNADGWLLRGEFGLGGYNPSVTTHGAALMFGYRTAVGPGFLAGYVGVAYESHLNTPGGAIVTGTLGGGKVGIEYLIPETGMFELYSLATYSTVFDTAFAFVRPSFRVAPNFRLGPEAMYYRNTAYSDARIGGFVGIKVDQIVRRGEIVLAGGFLRALVAGSRDGYYVNATFSIAR